MFDLLITHKQFNKDGTKDKSNGNRLVSSEDGTQTGMVEIMVITCRGSQNQVISMLVYQK
jgi:hypothetical protein